MTSDFSGDISAYQMEENGSLVQVFGQKLFVKNGTQLLEQVGSVRKIECLSQGGAVSVIWNKKDISKHKSSYLLFIQPQTSIALPFWQSLVRVELNGGPHLKMLM